MRYVQKGAFVKKRQKAFGQQPIRAIITIINIIPRQIAKEYDCTHLLILSPPTSKFNEHLFYTTIYKQSQPLDVL